jgi:NADH-quinone oxidoreductase subunit N
MINVVITLYYYLLVVKAAYLLEPEEQQPPIAVSPATKLMAAVLVTAMVVIGIYPTQVLDLVQEAASLLV